MFLERKIKGIIEVGIEALPPKVANQT